MKLKRGEGPDHTGPVAPMSILIFPKNAEVSLGFKHFDFKEDGVLQPVISQEHYVQKSAVRWELPTALEMV